MMNADPTVVWLPRPLFHVMKIATAHAQRIEVGVIEGGRTRHLVALAQRVLFFL